MCTCGCAWDGIEAGTVGRYDDMMKIRGNNIWPAAVDDVVFALPELAEYAGRVYFD
ncbi:MAG: phenylacetate--CoA ligase, partial [Gammaproteobacteria bacterium]|nr:phenylacetate--CoA ligase [Gammaproteobacteria bacterium]